MPVLETDRLRVRPLAMDDLDRIHHILDIELADAKTGSEGSQPLELRRRWLEWTVQGYEQHAFLYQPPYGERALLNHYSLKITLTPPFSTSHTWLAWPVALLWMSLIF
jgi:hypothetical protein